MNTKRVGPIGSTLWAWLFFFALTVALYFRALNGGFIWDDVLGITQNPTLHSSDALFKIWFSSESVDYWPVTYTLLRGEWLAFGLNPLGYHLVNIAIHAIACVLLWRIFLILKFPTPFIIAFIFCIHPINVESVAWIFQTKTTLAAVLTLATTLFYLRFIDGKKSKDYYWALFFFLVANLSKISAVTWPFVLLGFEWFNDGKIKKEAVRRLIPFFFISLILGLLNVFWYGHIHLLEVGQVARDDNFWSRLAGAGQVVAFSLYKSLVPLNLSFIYPRWEIKPETLVSWIPSLLIILALLFAVINRKWRTNSFFLLLLYILISMFPVLGFFNIYFMKFSWVTDHYLYLTIPGLIAVSTYYLVPALKSKQLKWILFSLVSLTYATLTFTRAAVYIDEKTIWRDTLQKNPESWMAHLNIGVEFSNEKNFSEAIKHYTEALRLKPDYADAHFNFGVALGDMGRAQDAIDHYRAALQINPSYSQAHFNLGAALASQGKPQEALGHYFEVLKQRPESAMVRFNIGNIFSRQGSLEEAKNYFLEAIRINPNYAKAHGNLGITLTRQGNIQGAIEHYSEALRLDPNDAEIHNNLGVALMGLGKAQDAIEHYKEALRQRPTEANWHFNLGKAYLMIGKNQEAKEEYKILKSLNSKLADELYRNIQK